MEEIIYVPFVILFTGFIFWLDRQLAIWLMRNDKKIRIKGWDNDVSN